MTPGDRERARPSGRRRLSPQTGHRRREQTIAEGDRAFPVVENHAELEVAPTSCGQLPRPLEVSGLDCRGCLDFDADQRAAIAFHDDVDLVLILVPIVMQRAGPGEPGSLFRDFGKNECLENRAEH